MKLIEKLKSLFPRSGKAQSLDELARQRKVRKAGWYKTNLQTLDGVLKAVLSRFNKIASHDLDFSIQYRKGRPKSGDEYVSVDFKNGRIKVFLSAGAPLIFEHTPTLLSNKLIEALFDENHLTIDFAPSKRVLLHDAKYVDAAVQEVLNYYGKERGITLDKDKVRNKFAESTELFGTPIMKQKLSMLLIKPLSPSRHRIALELNGTLSSVERLVSSPEIGDRQVPVWTVIAHLAMLSTLARKFGLISTALRCRDLLSQKNLGKHLIRIELIELKDRKLADRFTNIEQPFLVALQIEKAIAGYNLLMNNFEHIFEFYFDNAELY
jgi:hypothetical protein